MSFVVMPVRDEGLYFWGRILEGVWEYGSPVVARLMLAVCWQLHR